MNRVIQGDSLEELKKLPSDSVHCVITSPPYNKGTWRQRKMGNKGDSWNKAGIDYTGFDDALPQEEYEKQQRAVLTELVRIIKPEGSIFYNHKPLIYKHRLIYPTWVFDFNLRQQIIWDRGSTPSIDPIRFYPTTESLFWITKGPVQPKFKMPALFQSEVWRIHPKPMKEHPAPFPESLVENCILATTDVGDVVLDPYLGSGTVAVVAKRLRREYMGIELQEEYIKLTQARLEGMSGTLL